MIKNRASVTVKDLIIIFLFFLLPSFVTAQFSYSGSLNSRYADSENNLGFNEHLFDLNFDFNDSDRSFQGWTQFEFSDPPELGRPNQELRKLRLEYLTGNMTLKIGDIYEFWGMGMALNQVDDQAIDLDTGLRGLLFSYENDFFKWTILKGKTHTSKITNLIDGYDERVPNFDTNHDMLGTNIEYNYENGMVGVNLMQSNEKHDSFDRFGAISEKKIKHTMFGAYASFYIGNSSLFLEVLKKTSQEPTTNYDNEGTGLYSNLMLPIGDWSLLVEYKNYNFIKLSPLDKDNFINQFGYHADFINPPPGYYEHTTILNGRIARQANINDEIGYQVKLSGPIGINHTASINIAKASQHQSWIQNDNYEWETDKAIEGIPSSKAFAIPYNEIFINFDGNFFNHKLFYEIGWSSIKDVEYLFANRNLNNAPFRLHELLNSQSIPLSLTYAMNDKYSFEVKYEYQELKQGSFREMNNESSFMSVVGKPLRYNNVISLGLASSPKWSITYLQDNTSIDELSLKADQWVSWEILYRVKQNILLTYFNGSLKGGLVCSNGVCRYKQPFEDGQKVTLVYTF
jgi:hypothetical protein|tara:strand:+ start:635 stop:2347 length:1713 start_codon:yes stop_codon:yes gene_type:complete